MHLPSPFRLDILEVGRERVQLLLLLADQLKRSSVPRAERSRIHRLRLRTSQLAAQLIDARSERGHVVEERRAAHLQLAQLRVQRAHLARALAKLCTRPFRLRRGPVQRGKNNDGGRGAIARQISVRA